MSGRRPYPGRGPDALEAVLEVEATPAGFIGVRLLPAAPKGVVRLGLVSVEIARGWTPNERKAWQSLVAKLPDAGRAHAHAHRVLEEKNALLGIQRRVEAALRNTALPNIAEDAPPPTLRGWNDIETAVWPCEPEAPAAPAPAPLDLEGVGEHHGREAWPAPLLALLERPDDRPARAWVLAAARALESAGDLRGALEAHAALGDEPGLARLVARVPTPTLFSMLGEAPSDVIARLERGLRLEAAALAEHRALAERDARLAKTGAAIRAALARARSLALTLDGHATTYLLADEAIVGRGAELDVAAPVVGRRHLRLFRRGGAPHVEQLGGANGTTRAEGDELAGALRIDAPVSLLLGRAVRCSLAPHPAGVAVTIGERARVVTLGPLELGGIAFTHRGSHVVATGAVTLAGAPVHGSIELAIGDRLRSADGPEILVG